MPITKADLSASYCTEKWTRLGPGPMRAVAVSDGVVHIMDKGLSWLITDIAAYEAMPTPAMLKAAKDPAFQYLRFWTLDVNTDNATAVLTLRADSDKPAIVTQTYSFTDCPVMQVRIYSFENHSVSDPTIKRLLIMPSEN